MSRKIRNWRLPPNMLTIIVIVAIHVIIIVLTFGTLYMTTRGYSKTVPLLLVGTSNDWEEDCLGEGV